MNNKFNCTWIEKGISISHRGISLCCIHKNRFTTFPEDFWNGNYRKKANTTSQSNMPVQGCEGCYFLEKEKKIPSDRTYSKKYSYLENKDNPRIMLVDFSNFCNLKCIMCNPTRSSEWAKDIDKNNKGIRTVTKDLIDNTIKISKDLDTLIVQGGEPTIMEENIYFFKRLKEIGVIQNINLHLTTNGTNLNSKFYDLLPNFASTILEFSIDAYGDANNYIRYPSKFKQIEKNLIKTSNFPQNVSVEIHNSLNLLSLFNYGEFLEWCYKMQNLFNNKGKTLRIVTMNVTAPSEYSPFSAPDELKKIFINDVKNFLVEKDLTDNNKFKTEIMLLCKSMLDNKSSKSTIEKLLKQIKKLDAERSTQIIDYIPNFYQYI